MERWAQEQRAALAPARGASDSSSDDVPLAQLQTKAERRELARLAAEKKAAEEKEAAEETEEEARARRRAALELWRKEEKARKERIDPQRRAEEADGKVARALHRQLNNMRADPRSTRRMTTPNDVDSFRNPETPYVSK
jgi:predicted Holliday junction resolvase-like endonuclease